jgi:hypothetical protein
MIDPTTTAAVVDGAGPPPYSSEAYKAVEKSAAGLRVLYAPSVFEHAAQLLTALWATGEEHGVARSAWSWSGTLAGGALEVVARQYERPAKERTPEELFAMARDLLEAVTSDELGLTAKRGPGPASVVIERGPNTPRGGFYGDANVMVGAYIDSGWMFSFDADGASVMEIVAPATKAGASEVAGIVRAFVRGELGNPFRP